MVVELITIVIYGTILCLTRLFYYRIVQHSHPSCNNLMLIGIMLSLLAIIPGGNKIHYNYLYFSLWEIVNVT